MGSFSKTIRRVISFVHSCIFGRIWIYFMTLCLRILRIFKVKTFQISKCHCLSITKETSLFKMRIWCIKIGIVRNLLSYEWNRHCFLKICSICKITRQNINITITCTTNCSTQILFINHDESYNSFRLI
jgi:hypothetical protein